MQARPTCGGGSVRHGRSLAWAAHNADCMLPSRAALPTWHRRLYCRLEPAHGAGTLRLPAGAGAQVKLDGAAVLCHVQGGEGSRGAQHVPHGVHGTRRAMVAARRRRRRCGARCRSRRRCPLLPQRMQQAVGPQGGKGLRAAAGAARPVNEAGSSQTAQQRWQRGPIRVKAPQLIAGCRCLAQGPLQRFEPHSVQLSLPV